MLTKSEILGCPCYPISESSVEEYLLKCINSGIAGYSVAINAEKILNFSKNNALNQIINNSVLPYPDGAGAVLGLSLLHGLQSEKINMPIRALELANKYQLETFIVGAAESIHSKAICTIKRAYPNIKITGHLNGYVAEDKILSAIIEKKPQLILLAMGTPRQEMFASQIVSVCSQGLAIGCGGSLDIIAGRLKRAPEFWIHNNLEWLYRLIQEPWRWRRQLFLPLFIFKIIFHKLFRSYKLDNNRN